ncbi:MAG TPA: hypothetical protein VJN02_09945 [Gammaproteobacteria bacterium]|nr:hypothetical protein [Gammaproteobacteria bacterium]
MQSHTKQSHTNSITALMDKLGNTLQDSLQNPLITALLQDPDKAFQTLFDLVITKFREYDRTHANLNVSVRLLLYRYEDKLSEIEQVEKILLKEIPQKCVVKYLILCGLIQDMFTQYTLQYPQVDDDFTILLKTLLSNTLDNFEEYNCKQLFSIFRKQHSELYITEKKLIEFERSDYQNVLSDLRGSIDVRDDTVACKANNLIQAVEEEIEKQIKKQAKIQQIIEKEKNRPFDIQVGEKAINRLKRLERQYEQCQPQFALYAKELRGVTDFINNPGNIYGLNQFKSSYINQVSGQPRPSYTVVGAMVGFIGVALLTTSVMVAVATFGVSTPLSALGIVIGMTLMLKATSITASGILALATTLACCGLFAFGMRRGVSKCTEDFANALENDKQHQRRASTM